MRQFTYIFIAIMTLVSCSRQRVIPDGELAQIFRDAFLVNSYMTAHDVKADSLNIYEPVFERYGYTVEDVQYTIGNFSKRKSARLSDVVERSIWMLEMEGLKYNSEVAILDTVSAISRRKMKRMMLLEDEILVDSQGDSVNMKLRVESIERGDYNVSFDYLIDSLDENFGTYRTSVWFEKPTEIEGAKKPHYQENIAYLQRGKVLSFSKDFDVKSDYECMVIHLVDFLKKSKTPHVKIRNLKVEFTPEADKAERMFFEKMLNLKIFSDDLMPTMPKDSI